MFNLIFGKGAETDMFWNDYLIPETYKKFQIEKAMRYYKVEQ